MTTQPLSQRLFKQRKFRKLLAALLVIAVILGLLIVPIEKTPDSKFQSSFDGLYWAITTITTVGYGDFVPLTPLGKVLAIILQLVGAMMFGLIIAMISAYVNRTQDEFYWNRIFERIDRLEDKLGKVEKKSDFMVKDAE